MASDFFRERLFVSIARRLDSIDAAHLARACDAWHRDPHRSLIEILLSQGAIDATTQALVDNVVTAPLHCYRYTNDYWDRASGKHVLPAITVPTLVLNARNDPFMPAQYLPHVASKSVTLAYPATGGHVGFASGSLPGKLDWLPQRIVSFLTGALHQQPPATQRL